MKIIDTYSQYPSMHERRHVLPTHNAKWRFWYVRLVLFLGALYWIQAQVVG